MYMSRFIRFLFFCLFATAIKAQDFKDYNALHFSSAHTAFPDTGRANGHLYDSVLYTSAEHYSDSSVLLIIPKQLKKSNTVDLVFWFHGWRNNIDTAAEFYSLTRQFLASERNAVLVLAETAKNSPDSYGGKLEQPGTFRLLTDDVLRVLKKGGYVPDRTKAGNIVLAGHSGAFGSLPTYCKMDRSLCRRYFYLMRCTREVDKYQNWINQDWSHHFIHWFTNHGGGTDEVSDFMMTQLKNHTDHFLLTEEVGIKPKTIKDNYILFVHSLREHNVIINNPDNFQFLLENSFVLHPIK